MSTPRVDNRNSVAQSRVEFRAEFRAAVSVRLIPPYRWDHRPIISVNNNIVTCEGFTGEDCSFLFCVVLHSVSGLKSFLALVFSFSLALEVCSSTIWFGMLSCSGCMGI